MTPREYRKLIERLGVSQSWGGRHLATENTGRQWGTGRQKIPLSARVVLRLLDDQTIKAEDVERASGVDEPDNAMARRKNP